MEMGGSRNRCKGWSRRRLLALLLVGACIPGGASAGDPACLGSTSAARTAHVPDARSVSLVDGRVLRLAGIEPFAILLEDAGAAEEALRHRLGALLDGATLRFALLATEPDRHGRFPALVAAEDGRLVQEIVAREGLAIAFPAGIAAPCFEAVLSAENEARWKGRGFWKGALPLPWASPAALRPHIGRFTIFEGRVISVGNRRATTYLNFGRRWTEDVTAEIAEKDRESFGGEARLADLAGKRVRLRGYLEEKAGPLMKLRVPQQLELLDQ
jgi:endonuclease YncB( thermonuclease family)